MSKHQHNWNFIRTFVAEGKPRVMQQDVTPFGSAGPRKVKTWIDAKQEYALYHCVCGERKQVEL